MNKYQQGEASPSADTISGIPESSEILITGSFSGTAVSSSSLLQSLTSLNPDQVYRICAVETSAPQNEYPLSVKYVLNTSCPGAFGSVIEAINKDKQVRRVVLIYSESLDYSEFISFARSLKKEKVAILPGGINPEIKKKILHVADTTILISESGDIAVEGFSDSDDTGSAGVLSDFYKVFRTFGYEVKLSRAFNWLPMRESDRAKKERLTNSLLARACMEELDKISREPEEISMTREALTA